MAKKVTVTGNLVSYYIDKPDRTWVFDKNCHVDNPDGNGILVAAGVTNTVIILQGTVQASHNDNFSAIITQGEGSSITIAKGAKALGPYGAIAFDPHSEIDNFGTANSLRVNGHDSVITNTGRIVSDLSSGLGAWADNCTLINEEGGRINVSVADSPYASAIKLNTQEGQAGLAINHGMIRSGNISGASGNDTIVNDGTVNSDVLTFDGKDRVDNRGGTITGVISTGKGDDVLTTDKATDVLLENAGGGLDTVRSTVSYTLNANVEALHLIGKANINGTATNTTEAREYLYGNNGNNVLKGLDGYDVLDPHAGKDVLVGGAGLDLFVYKKGYGQDTVRDFHHNQDDHIILYFKNVDDITDIADNLTKHGKDTWLDMGHGDVLILKNVVTESLTNSDFGW